MDNQLPQLITAPEQGSACYTIEQVASRTNLTKRTLRYYEEVGLLPPAIRTEGNYRRYSEDDIERIEHIKKLRDLLDFSLTDIRELLQADDERGQIREANRQETDTQRILERLERADELIIKQLNVIEQKISGLQQMRDQYQSRLQKHARIKNELQNENP